MGLTFEKYKIRIFIWLITKVLKINIPSFKLLSDNSDFITMKKLELNQMENVEGGNQLCSLLVGVGIGVLVGSVTAGFGGIFVGSLLGMYASNAFC